MALSTKKLELVIYGYIKELKLSDDIPDVINDVIIQFAKFYFNWKNSKYNEESYAFKEEDPTRLVRSKANRGWQFLAMDEVVSLDVCRKLEWELKIIELIDRDLAFMFGFVEYPVEESIQNWKTYFGSDKRTKDKQYGIYVDSSHKVFQRHGCRTAYSSGSTDKWREGDRFGLIVDIEAKQMNLMYNDKDIGIIYDHIPDKIQPAICIYDSLDIQCTKYEFH